LKLLSLNKLGINSGDEEGIWRDRKMLPRYHRQALEEGRVLSVAVTDLRKDNLAQVARLAKSIDERQQERYEVVVKWRSGAIQGYGTFSEFLDEMVNTEKRDQVLQAYFNRDAITFEDFMKLEKRVEE